MTHLLLLSALVILACVLCNKLSSKVGVPIATGERAIDLREFEDAIVFKVALMVKKYLSANPAKY